jgi:hypothetical protein
MVARRTGLIHHLNNSGRRLDSGPDRRHAQISSRRGVIYVIEALKEHKNENVFGSDFELCTISLLVMLKY